MLFCIVDIRLVIGITSMSLLLPVQMVFVLACGRKMHTGQGSKASRPFQTGPSLLQVENVVKVTSTRFCAAEIFTISDSTR